MFSHGVKMKIKHSQHEYLDQYAKHLKNLSVEDRYTRFGYAASDQAIDQFILSILYNREKHHLFSYFDKDGVVGFGHLAQDDNNWELAVSVDKQYQGLGIANELMQHMIDWGKTHGVHAVFMHCISDNKKIQHLARKHGLKTVDRSGTEVTAQVQLPNATVTDLLGGLIREQTDLATDIVKLQRTWLRNWTIQP